MGAGRGFQGKERADHAFSHPLGLDASLGSYPALNIEAGVPPGEKALRPFLADELPAQTKRQDLPGEEFGQARDLKEDTRLVHSALGHQEVEVGTKIDPVPKWLDGRDDSGLKRTPGHFLEVYRQGVDSAAVNISRSRRLYLKKRRSILGMVKTTWRWGTSRRSSSLIHSPHSSSLWA